ncbi:MAG: nicotinate phosphoribosyltransferase [Mycoplasmataceae bacterium]|nr:nicotinate phosphoribosyltransferase [Mycoplasmataceae bacterium]
MKIKDYVANYFFITESILKKYKPNAIVKVQFFQRNDDVMLSGMKEVLKLLKNNTDTSKYEIKHLNDQTIISNLEPVLELTGKYEYFGVFEGVIDGILARSSSIATNAYRCIQAANGKNIVYMGDRGDHYKMQEIDGQAVEDAGIIGHSTLAGSQGNVDVIFGSIPHILIQHFDGNTLEAMKAYVSLFPQEKEFIALVDFNNDVINDSLDVLKELGKKLWGVRVDTSKNMVDKMFANEEPQYGVNVEQIKRLRKALDENNGSHVKIIVSSGFTYEKIKFFEDNFAPVDSYGVGESILKINIGFSCDAVVIDGKKLAKVGRGYRENKNLILFK